MLFEYTKLELLIFVQCVNLLYAEEFGFQCEGEAPHGVARMIDNAGVVWRRASPTDATKSQALHMRPSNSNLCQVM